MPRGGFQPYHRKRTERLPGHALNAMSAGRPLYLPNPIDSRRNIRQPKLAGGTPLSDLLSAMRSSLRRR